MKRVIWGGGSGAILLLLLLAISCSKNSSSGGSTTPTGNSDSILLNIGNNIIVPSYQKMAVAANSLDSAIGVFNSSPNATNLSNVQTVFQNAYSAWQSISEYNYFGPASVAQPVLTTLNIFPTNDSIIESNISKANFNINTFVNTAAKGFPALDYLLYGVNKASANSAAVLANYTTDANASNRKQYLAAVCADIKTEVNGVVNAWLPSGGNYINTFINGSGTSTSSSLGLLINSMDQDFEILKNDRLGIPLGKIPVGTNLPLAPKEVEAYYSGISLQLAVAQLKAVQGIYLGTSMQANGLGLIGYLKKAEALNSTLKYHGGLLSDTIKTEFSAALNYTNAIPSTLSANLSNTNALAAFNECQLLVTLLKTDMPSDLGVLISYGDNDGD